MSTTIVKHEVDTEARPSKTDPEVNIWRGICSCGWKGRETADLSDAEDAAWAHEDKHGGV